MRSSGDDLIARILDGDGDCAYDLLTECFRGYPVENIGVLFRSRAGEVVKRGAWLASELAEKARPLINELVAATTHPLPFVRYYSMQAIALSATIEHGAALAAFIRLTQDPHSGVRMEAARLLGALDEEELVAAKPDLDFELSQHISKLVSPLNAASADDIRTRLRSDNVLDRLFGFAAALRAGPDSLELLHEATQSEDADIRSSAQGALDNFRSRAVVRKNDGR